MFRPIEQAVQFSTPDSFRHPCRIFVNNFLVVRSLTTKLCDSIDAFMFYWNMTNWDDIL